MDREQHGADLKCGRPLVLENVETDSAEFVDVGMVDLSSEQNFGRDHRVLVGQEELAVEKATFVWGFGRSRYLNEEMAEVGGIRLSVDADDGVLC